MLLDSDTREGDRNLDSYTDEEGLLKVIKAVELSEEITKLNWNWDSYSDAIKQSHELMEKSQKLFLEISEYEQRMGSKLTKYQKNIPNVHKLIQKKYSRIQEQNIYCNYCRTQPIKWIA